MVSMNTTIARYHIYLHDPLAWTLATIPQHLLAQLSQLLLFSAVLCKQLAVFLPYQLLGFPCRLESLGKLVNLTKLPLSAVLSSHLVLPPFPNIPAHVELLLRVALLSNQVVELVHRKSDDVLDGKHDATLPRPLLVLAEPELHLHHLLLVV